MRISCVCGLAGLAVLLLGGGCGSGGGDGGDGGGDDRTIVLSIDGRDWDGHMSGSGGAMVVIPTYIVVGDTPTAIQVAYLGFLRTVIPAGATVRTARLRLYHGETAGTPYAKLGEIYVDHVEAVRHTEVPFVGGALEERIGPLSESSAQGWREVVVTDNVRDDIVAGRVHSVFRLRFWQPVVGFLDGETDRVSIEDFENSNGDDAHPPELVVTYTP